MLGTKAVLQAKIHASSAQVQQDMTIQLDPGLELVPYDKSGTLSNDNSLDVDEE